MLILTIFIFIVGACVGSFINVCIWRIPRNESIVLPPSHCPQCGHNLSWFENIPLLSWIFLCAKCRKCRKPISSRYFWVELLTAFLFIVVWLKALNTHNLYVLLPHFTITAFVIATVFIDSEYRMIPDEITYPTMIAGLVFSVVWPQNWHSHIMVISHLMQNLTNFSDERVFAFAASLISMSAGLMFFTVAAWVGEKVFKCEALGWGDVKYLGAVGACLGIPACFFTVLAGSLLGSAYGIVLMLLRKGGFKTAIAFGPFLGIGTFIWIIFGGEIMKFYLFSSQFLSHWIQKLGCL